MAATSSGIEYPVASDFVGPLNAHLQTLAETTQGALDTRTPAVSTTYMPTLSGVTLGNGTVSARSTKIGAIIIDSIAITFGSTTAVTGEVTIGGMPTGMFIGQFAPCGNVSFHDSGVTINYGVATESSATSITVNAIGTGGSYATRATLSSTVPQTWSSGDQILIKTVRLAA